VSYWQVEAPPEPQANCNYEFRGWRIGKDKQVHKIDVVVALAMACYAAVSSQGEYDYNLEAMC